MHPVLETLNDCLMKGSKTNHLVGVCIEKLQDSMKETDMPSELRILLAGRIGLTNWPDSLSKDELIEAQIQALHTLIVVHLIPKYLLRWDVDSLPNKASEDLNSFVFELKNSISNESNELQRILKLEI